MTTTELWAQYQSYTQNLTEHSRKLGFAGVAICWFFRAEDFTFPAWIYAALVSFVAYFLCDILHMFIGALLTRRIAEKEEFRLLQETGSITGNVKKPRWIDWPAFTFFCMKTVLLMLGFVFIASNLASRLEDSRRSEPTYTEPANSEQAVPPKSDRAGG